MSEFQTAGPLDIQRNLDRRAEELDAVAPEYLSEFPERAEAYRNEIFNLDSANPLTGLSVMVYGDLLTISVDEDGVTVPVVKPPVMPESRFHKFLRKVEGIYDGYTLVSVYDTVNGSETPTVAHRIATASCDYPDEFGNNRETTYFTYVPVRGAEVIPIMPVNSHSMEDLKDDEVVARFDKITSDAQEDAHSMVRLLGSYANQAFNVESRADDFEMNRQRVSYLNALGVLDDRSILTRDMVFCGDDEEPTYNIAQLDSFSDMSRLFELTPTMFVTAQGYTRHSNAADMVLLKENIELYTEAVTSDGRIVLAPVKNIVGVH